MAVRTFTGCPVCPSPTYSSPLRPAAFVPPTATWEPSGDQAATENEAEFTAYRDETAQRTGADLGGPTTTAADEYPGYNS